MATRWLKIELKISELEMETKFFKVDVISKNTLLELNMCTMNFIELLKELAKVIKSFRQSRFLTHFILILFMNRNRLKGLKEAPIFP